jgi:F0F1-type ATP synthase membrane subunit c/vacuolar-type H+-ATPase subunit K
MLLTLLVLPTVLIIYGFVLLFLALQPAARSIPLELMEVAAISYAIPGLLTGLGMALIYRRGAAAVAVRKELFGRILTAGVLPHTAALFGLITSFLILGGLLIWADSIPAVGFATQYSIVSRAAFYISLGALGAPLSAFLFTFKWDFATEEAWGRALALATLGEVVSIVGLVFAMSVLLGS